MTDVMSGTGHVFAHGVASGDPLPDGMVLWTRVTGARRDGAEVGWAVATDPSLDDVVAWGTGFADPQADYTVHVDVSGLRPGTPYYYGFSALGHSSPVGSTRTLPGDGTAAIRLATVSCAKYNAGFFNAYGRIADRTELDFVVHLGDYIYEAAQKPPPSQTPAADIGREVDPLHECITLDDYRRRYAHYHLDPDVQRLHAAHPVIASLDDHELADGAWREGSVEHIAGGEDPWADRRARAFRARWEWLPARPPDPADPERVFRSVHVGRLADLFLVDTRSRRDEPVPPPAMYDPGRTALGPEQREWLLRELTASTARWRLLCTPSVFGHTWSEALPATARRALAVVKLINADGDGPDSDQWDGYPAERDLILRHLAENGIGDVVILSGDVHISLALEVRRDPFDPSSPSLAAEFTTASLTSQNVDDKMHWPPRTESLAIEEAMVKALPHVAWCELDSNG
ncbi:MAG TPA: alkaline phosphatase D family protein, partial [Acidimicrobiales bacterium]|nr:alkaline phosphatase D family protein [Acidimicrobiales bacterium]